MKKVESGAEFIHKTDDLLHKNRSLIFFAFVNVTIMIILIIGYLQLRKDLVMKVDIPPKLYSQGTLFVGAVRANSLYYKVWGQYVVEEMSQYSPANIEERLRNISIMLHPDKYIEYKHLIVKKNDFVISNMLQRKYIPTRETVEMIEDKHIGIFTSKGIATDVMGDGVNISYKKCTFIIKMSIDNYHLFVNELGENCQVIDDAMYKDALSDQRIIENKYIKGIR